jgi:transposase
MPNKIFDELIKKDPTKYPARMGKSWSNEEDQQLLQEIQKKVPIDMIAEFHERTQGAITSHLRQIAADYYFHNEMPIDKIQKYTGLSIDEISDAISRREFREKQKQEKQTKTAKLHVQESPVFEEPKKNENDSDTKEIISLLKEIKGLLERFLQSIHYEE